MEAARRAEPADVPTLCALAAEARAHLVDQRGGPQRLLELRPAHDDETAFTALVADPSAFVVVGSWDHLVGAYAATQRVERRDGTAVARVDELYVQPDLRELGVAEAMMGLVLAWAAEQGCAAVEAVALPGDRLTKNFFERFGLTARAIVVARSLG